MDAWAGITENTETNILHYAAADDSRYTSSRHVESLFPSCRELELRYWSEQSLPTQAYQSADIPFQLC